MTPEERALEAIGNKTDRLVGELISAALGEGDFTDLKLDTRVTALTRLLEWKLGRPGAVKPKAEEPEETPAGGDALFE